MSTTTARTSAAPKLDKETNRAFDPLAHKLDYSKISTTGRGYLEYVDHISGQLRICGWMLNAEQPWDSFVLKVNGAPIAEVSPRTRNDVRDFLKTPAFSEMTGFWFDVPTAASQFTNFARLDIVGKVAGRESTHLTLDFKIGFRSGLTTPPPELMYRVANTRNENCFWTGGLTAYSHFSRVLHSLKVDFRNSRLLDWGCGCGRMTGLFLAHTPFLEVHGCDIDAEAVAWCSQTLPKGRFSTIPFNPPTQYESGKFDVIIGYSVLTHLVKQTQLDWILEMRRLLKTGGLFLASCHGDFVVSYSGATIQEQVNKYGISDATLDTHLHRVAPEGYYRSTYQSRAYTESDYGKHFEIVQYLPRGVSGSHDLVVMRKS